MSKKGEEKPAKKAFLTGGGGSSGTSGHSHANLDLCAICPKRPAETSANEQKTHEKTHDKLRNEDS